MPDGATLFKECAGYLKPDDVAQLQTAYQFSESAHKGQFRNSGEPYISHPLAVAGILAKWHLDTQALTAALLHDVMEDTAVTKVELQQAFGKSVAVSGTRVVVGADWDAPGATYAGSAYVYDLSSATPTVPVATLNNPRPAARVEFGFSVAISGTRVVVGAKGDNTGASEAGSAYVYDLGSATPTVPVATLNNPGPAAGDQFGSSVAISGTRVVVGASEDDTGVRQAGSAYVYDLTSATPTVPVATHNNPGPAVNDNFGTSVAIDGTTIAIGAPLDDLTVADKGAAYIYGPSPYSLW